MKEVRNIDGIGGLGKLHVNGILEMGEARKVEIGRNDPANMLPDPVEEAQPRLDVLRPHGLFIFRVGFKSFLKSRPIVHLFGCSLYMMYV